MDAAAAEQDLPRPDPDQLALGEALAQDLGRCLVGLWIEQGEDDARGGEIEVDVGGGEASAGEARLLRDKAKELSWRYASSALTVSGPGEGMRTTSSRRPRASVAASRRARASRATSR